jgi:hypothetical protein
MKYEDDNISIDRHLRYIHKFVLLGILFTPKSDEAVAAIREIFASQAEQRGLKVIGWRPIETGTHFFLNVSCMFFNILA